MGERSEHEKFWGYPKFQKTARCNLVIELNFEDNIEDGVEILHFAIFLLYLSISQALALCASPKNFGVSLFKRLLDAIW